MSGWRDTLEAQHDLFKFWRSPVGEVYGRYYLNDKQKKDPELDLSELTGGNKLHVVEASKMLLADPIYVSEDMFDIAETASETFEPEPLHETDLLTRYGFVLLPRPFVAPDVHGKNVTWRAFSWMEMHSPDGKHSGVHFSTYSHREDYELDDYFDESWEAALDWQPLHITPWWFGMKAPESFEGVRSWWTKCQSLMRLTMQQIATRDELDAPRATRRRLGRAGSEFNERKITVVRLRRPRSKPTENERDVEWSHRWIVSGHWRNQWFPSLNTHRQIWIGNYVKGPEDRPLVIRKARAYELVR